MKSEVYKRKLVIYDELLARILPSASRKKKLKQASFAHELQSALRLTVGFSNIYCELNKLVVPVQQMFYLNMTLNLN